MSDWENSEDREAVQVGRWLLRAFASMTHTDRRGHWLVCVGLRMAIKTQFSLLTCFKADEIHTKLMGFMSAPDHPRPLETQALVAVEREDANDVEVRV